MTLAGLAKLHLYQKPLAVFSRLDHNNRDAITDAQWACRDCRRPLWNETTSSRCRTCSGSGFFCSLEGLEMIQRLLRQAAVDRIASGVTQTRLAEDAEIRPCHMSKFLNGKALLGGASSDRLARVLSVQVRIGNHKS